MRIFIIHNYYQSRGGEDVVFENEVKALSQNHEVQTFTTKNLKGIKGFFQFLLYPFNIWGSKSILRKIKKFSPDIVHIHNIHYTIGPDLIRRLNRHNIPHIITLHNYRLICPSATLYYKNGLFLQSLTQQFPWAAVFNKVHESSYIKTFWIALTYYLHKKIGTWYQNTYFIVLSEFSKNIFLSSTLKIRSQNFRVKANFIPDTPFIEHVKREGHFLYVGRLSKEKGVLQFLRNLVHLPFKIKIIGSGPDEIDIEDLAHRFPEKFEYLGYRDQSFIRRQMMTCSALVVPSTCLEGMPLTLIEAYASGTAVIASDIGIFKEMVDPMVTGLLFDPYSTKDIHDKLSKWLSLEDTEKFKISQNCLLTFKTTYSEKVIVKKLEEIYETVIKK